MNKIDEYYENFEEYPNGWISVDKFLPEEDQWVLVWYAIMEYGWWSLQMYGLGMVRSGKWQVDKTIGGTAIVLAWQPLPDKYKGTEEEIHKQWTTQSIFYFNN